MANNKNKKNSGDGKTDSQEKTNPQVTPDVTATETTDTTENSGDGKTDSQEKSSSSENEATTDTQEAGETSDSTKENSFLNDEQRDELNTALDKDRSEENDGKNEKAEKNIAAIFDTKSQNEPPPQPHSRQRVPGVKPPPAPRGGWYLFIDPVSSHKSVVTESAKNILLKEKTPLRYLGACDEKGKLLNDGKI